MTSINDDLLVEHMRKFGIPVTRENYVQMNYGNTPPLDWTLENELELPDELQDWTWVEQHYPDYYGQQPQKKTHSGVGQDAWNEYDHPRGQPENAGEFVKGSGTKGSGTKSSGSRVSPGKAPAPSVAMPTAPKRVGTVRKPPVGSKTADRVNEGHHERVTAILSRHGGNETPEQAAQMVIDIAQEAYRFMGVDREHVPFDEEKSKILWIGKDPWDAHGTFYPGTNHIALSDEVTPYRAAPSVASLLMKAKYHAFNEAYHKEQNAIWAEPNIDDVMDNDGKIKDPYKDKYPVSAAMPQGFGSAEKRRADDGITDLSRAMWKAEEAGTVSTDEATVETLAEMAMLDWEGSLPRLLWFKQSKTFRPIYEAIHKAYPVVAAQQPHGRVPETKPVEPPRPAPKMTTETVAGVTVETADNASPGFATRMKAVIKDMPDRLTSSLRASGATVVIGDRLTDVGPELKGQSPRGWPPGATWDNVGGVFHHGTKRAMAAEHYRTLDNKRMIENTHAETTIRHEMGHAFDEAIGWYSEGEKYKEAYAIDVAKIAKAPPEVAQRYEYFLQPGVAGLHESFAETVAELTGGSLSAQEGHPIGEYFHEIQNKVLDLLV